MDTPSLTFAVPARVQQTVAERATDLLAIAKQRIYDPAILDERAPFFWSAEISSDLIDAYYTHMLPSTLTNFAADAKAGVAFLPGHNHRELPFGHSLDAMMESAADPERTRVVADFYTLSGLKLNGVTTDDLIAGIRSGILRDVSVGFYGGQHLCDICGRDYWDWDCMHIPGLKYEVKQGDVVRLVLSTFGVEGARLSEVSSVFDGATPQAGVLKAEREAAEGRLRPDAIRILEERYRVKLPVAKRQFAGANTPGKEQRSMEFEQIVNQVRETLGLSADADVPGAVARLSADASRLAEVEQRATTAEQRIKELEPQAEIGAQYRADLITAALAEGVRALGDKFNSDTYKRMLEGLDLAGIKQLKSDWETQGNARFTGGRSSTDAGEDAPGKQRTNSKLPAKAHKV